jgi:hypothetical protein
VDLRAAALVAIAACGRFGGFTPIPDAEGSQNQHTETPDASDAAIATGCAPPAAPQPFASACDPWGWLTSDGVSISISGQFSVSLTAGYNNSFGGCISQSSMPFDNGVLTEVLTVLDPTLPTYTGLQAWGTTSGSFYLFVQSQQFQFWVNNVLVATIPYDPTMTWWRIRPDTISATLVAEVSRDAQVWVAVGSASVPIPASVTTQVGTGYNGISPANAGTTVFRSVNICP